MAQNNPLFKPVEEPVATVNQAILDLKSGIDKNEAGLTKMLNFLNLSQKDGVEDLKEAQKLVIQISSAMTDEIAAELGDKQRDMFNLFKEKVKQSVPEPEQQESSTTLSNG